MAITSLKSSGYNLALRAGQLSNQGTWKPVKKKVGTDPYSTAFRAGVPPNLDPWQFPQGGLQGMGDLAGSGTGIDFIDQNLRAISQNVADAAMAAKITMYCSIAAGVGTVLLFFRTARR